MNNREISASTKIILLSIKMYTFGSQISKFKFMLKFNIVYSMGFADKEELALLEVLRSC